MNKKAFFSFSLVMALALAPIARAERADREKPVNLDADKITVDDARKVHVFEGNVLLTQGTLTIKADKLVVTQDVNGFQTGVATGGPGGLSHFRQKREGRDEYIDGEGDRIENDARTDKTEFFGHAKIRSGQDEVRGQYISYDGRTENYIVTNGPDGSVAAGTKAERVHAIIQPKNKDAVKVGQ